MRISEQVKHLKELSDSAKSNVYSFEALSQSLKEAADTIESLSAKLVEANKELSFWRTYYINEKIKSLDCKNECTEKLEVADMERSAEDCSGWILCRDRLPEISEYMEFEPTPYMKRLEIAYMADTVEYLIGYYDGSKWMDKHHNIIKNVVAWKPFLKLPEKRHEP